MLAPDLMLGLLLAAAVAGRLCVETRVRETRALPDTLRAAGTPRDSRPAAFRDAAPEDTAEEEPGFTVEVMFAPGLLLLHGVMNDEHGKNAVVSVWGGPRQIVRVDDRIHGYEILRIDPRQITVTRRGVDERLGLRAEQGDPTATEAGSRVRS